MKLNGNFLKEEPMNDPEHTVSDYRKAACWVVCPTCDEVICEGRFECPQINEWIEEKLKGEKK